MHIRVVTPIVTQGFRALDELDDLTGPGITLSRVHIDYGPASIECAYDDALAVPGTLEKIQQAERDGVDAVVVDCMADPAVEPARELVSIPVVGPAQASMHVASMLAYAFSVVTVFETLTPQFERQALAYGAASHLASVRAVEIPVLELCRDKARTTDALVAASLQAMEDGAHAIVLGCTGLLGYAGMLQGELAGHGYPRIPVIDPIPTAVRLAASLVDLGLTQSGRTYPAPPPKVRVPAGAQEPALRNG